MFKNYSQKGYNLCPTTQRSGTGDIFAADGVCFEVQPLNDRTLEKSRTRCNAYEDMQKF